MMDIFDQIIRGEVKKIEEEKGLTRKKKNTKKLVTKKKSAKKSSNIDLPSSISTPSHINAEDKINSIFISTDKLPLYAERKLLGDAHVFANIAYSFINKGSIFVNYLKALAYNTAIIYSRSTEVNNSDPLFFNKYHIIELSMIDDNIVNMNICQHDTDKQFLPDVGSRFDFMIHFDINKIDEMIKTVHIDFDNLYDYYEKYKFKDSKIYIDTSENETVEEIGKCISTLFCFVLYSVYVEMDICTSIDIDELKVIKDEVSFIDANIYTHYYIRNDEEIPMYNCVSDETDKKYTEYIKYLSDIYKKMISDDSYNPEVIPYLDFEPL